MKYLSVCSGIEAATVAWHRLGWQPVAFSEIEKFPSAVLAHHYPSVPNWGDMTKFQEWPDANVDVLVGGTPCQSFSVAGLRKGLADPRGNLMLTFGAIAQRYRPRWLVWENVPGVLSSNGGRDFGTFLGMLGELGYGFAYRILDAQYVRTHQHPRAVPQRRRRVFVVGYLGDWHRAAAVLFERHSLSGHPAPSRQTRKGAAAGATVSTGISSGNQPEVMATLCAEDATKWGSNQWVNEGKAIIQPTWWDGGDIAPTLTKQNASGAQRMPDKDNFGAVLQPVSVDILNHSISEIAHTLSARSDQQVGAVLQPIAIQGNLVGRTEGGPQGVGASEDGVMYTLTKADVHAVAQPIALQDISGREKKQNGRGWNDDGTSYTLDAAATQGVAAPLAFKVRGGCEGGGKGYPGSTDTAFTISTTHDQDVAVPVAFGVGESPEVSHCLRSGASKADKHESTTYVQTAMQVRRLLPTEAEALQGFPRDYTNIPWRGKPESPDGPRYKALGNSMAVPCMSWIGKRIQQVEEI